MGRIYNKIKRNFTIVPNEILLDKSVSAAAKTVYWYMCSKPEDWDFYLDNISHDLGINKETVRKYISQLCEAGWIIKGEQSNDNGIFGNVEYEMCETKGAEPSMEITDTVKIRHGENRARKIPPRYISNIDNTNIEEENNIDSNIDADWRENYEYYVEMVIQAEEELKADDGHKTKMEQWYDNIDYEKSLIKTADWWKSIEGWQYAKRKKKGGIDMIATLKRNFERNKLYKSRFAKESGSQGKYESLDDKLKKFKEVRDEFYGLSE